jgi:putative phage-type endonuclease
MTIAQFQNIFVPLFIDGINQFINTEQNNKLSKKHIQIEMDNHCKGNNINQVRCSTQVFNYYVENYKILTQRTLDVIYENTFITLLGSASGDIYNIVNGIYNLTKQGLHILIVFSIYHHPDVITYLQNINKSYVEYNKKQIQYLDNLPNIEQKTEEWFKVRKNMISASICGYIDSKNCSLGISKETEQIKEKSDLSGNKCFSWGCHPLRHGQQYEDVSGHVYNTFNRLKSKEYGILQDKHYTHIGASPDGIITNVLNEDNYNYGRMMGRMREIKNPVSRKINHKIPSYYYWQMQQQMYVCNLPICDFIQTSFNYNAKSTTNNYTNFSLDKLDTELLNNAKCWQDIKNLFASYILQNLKMDVFWQYMIQYNIINQPLQSSNDINEIETNIVKLFINEFSHISPIPLENISNSGFLKGVMWCLTKKDACDNIEFKVMWTPMDIPIDNEQYINDLEYDFIKTFKADGYNLDEKHFWTLDDYKVIEVEYNQGLYEGENYITHKDNLDTLYHHIDDSIIKRLNHKWDIITHLRSINDIEERTQQYLKYYPDTSIKNAKNNNSLDTKTKYKKRRNTTLIDDKWSIRDNDIIYDLS